MSETLSPAMRKHLVELVNAPYWGPADPGEWSIARALERRGYLAHNPSRGHRRYSLTASGREAGLRIRASELEELHD